MYASTIHSCSDRGNSRQDRIRACTVRRSSAIGLDGQGAVKNAYWDAKPGAEVQAGTYAVTDSDPSTWSTNDQAKGLASLTILGTYK